VRYYSDIDPTGTHGGFGPAAFPTVMTDPASGTNAWFLGARNGVGAGIDYTPSSLLPGAVYDVWIDITNAPMNDPVAGFVPDTFSVYLLKEGDPSRTLVFDSYASDRDPTYVDSILGSMEPNLDKLVVAGNSATSSAMFDDFYLSAGAYLASVPRAFGYSLGPLPPLHISFSGGQVQIQWTLGTLQQAPALTGPWSDVVGAAPPAYALSPAGRQLFFRARP